MMKKKFINAFLALLLTCGANYEIFAQDMVIVRPKEIHDVLNNPGKGFTTFQMFNGDNLEPN